MRRRPLAAILFVCFIDMLGFGLILPLLPFYATRFQANEFTIGLLIATFPLGQMIAGPILGRLSDRVGRRPVLLVSVAGTALAFVMLGLAHTLWLLFLARFVDGLTGGSTTVAQAYIADVTEPDQRARALGLMGAMFGFAFLIGPVMGGVLSHVGGLALPAFAAAGLAGLNFLLLLLWLPESHDAARRAQQPAQSRGLARLRETLTLPRVAPLLLLGFFVRLTHWGFASIFSLYAMSIMGLDTRATGLLLGYLALLVIVVQGGAIGPLTRAFRDEQLILFMWSLNLLSLLGWAVSPSVPMLMLVLIPLVFSGAVLSTVLQSMLTKTAGRARSGAVLGVGASLESMARIITPVLGGLLLGRIGGFAPGIVYALVLLVLLPYVWLAMSRRTGEELEAGESEGEPIPPML